MIRRHAFADFHFRYAAIRQLTAAISIAIAADIFAIFAAAMRVFARLRARYFFLRRCFSFRHISLISPFDLRAPLRCRGVGVVRAVRSVRMAVRRAADAQQRRKRHERSARAARGAASGAP